MTLLYILAFPLMFGLTMLFCNYTLPILYGYRVSDSGIWVVVLHLLPVYRISFHNIKEIRRSAPGELGPTKVFLLRLGNRIWGEPVLIRKRGLFRSVVITPDKPDEFIATVQSHLSIQTTHNPT
jgi:hypothetical protein